MGDGMRLWATRARTEIEVEMVVLARTKDEALEITKEHAEAEAENVCHDWWERPDAEVDREVRTLDDLPEDWDGLSSPWDENGMSDDLVDDLLDDIPADPYDKAAATEGGAPG